VAWDFGFKFGDEEDGQSGVAHLLYFFDELIDQVTGAGSEGEFDVR
jgi:hypothetical protein